MRVPILWLGCAFFLLRPVAFAQTPTPTTLPGCCMQSPNWTASALGTGTGVAVDRVQKRVYATDQTAGLIKAFTYDGKPDRSFGAGTGQAAMAMVMDVAVGPCNYPGVYAVNRSLSPSIVSKFDLDGDLVWTSPPLPDGGAFCITVDDYGNSYVSSGYGAVYILDKDGNQKTAITGTGSWALNTPIGLVVQGLQLYVADTGNNRFVQFTQTGVNSYIYAPTQAVTIAPLSPYGLAQDLNGNFYVAFQNSNGYQIYDGQLNPITPMCAPASGALQAAFGIAVDETGAVYVADNSGTAKLVKMLPCFNQPSFTGCYKGSDPPSQDECFIFPSPAKGDHASLSYFMAGSGQMDLKVFNENGELAADIQDRKASGIQVTAFDLSRLAPGVYYYVVTLSYDSGQSVRLKPHKFTVIR